MLDGIDFWFGYISQGRQRYLTDNIVDADADPVLVVIFDWLKRIEAAMQKAWSERRHYFSSDLVQGNRKIAFRFVRRTTGFLAYRPRLSRAGGCR